MSRMPTTIEWTDERWNPVTGCTRVSPGCDKCYMFRDWPRLHGMGVKGYEGPPDVPVTPCGTPRATDAMEETPDDI